MSLNGIQQQYFMPEAIGPLFATENRMQKIEEEIVQIQQARIDILTKSRKIMDKLSNEYLKTCKRVKDLVDLKIERRFYFLEAINQEYGEATSCLIDRRNSVLETFDILENNLEQQKSLIEIFLSTQNQIN